MTNDSSKGFSLVELMAALAIGALMAHALLSAQHYSLGLATHNKQSWENLNFTQDLLARQGLHQLSRPTGTWIVSLDNPGARWMTLEEPAEMETMHWVEMHTDYRGNILKWSWPLTR